MHMAYSFQGVPDTTRIPSVGVEIFQLQNRNEMLALFTYRVRINQVNNPRRPLILQPSVTVHQAFQLQDKGYWVDRADNA